MNSLVSSAADSNVNDIGHSATELTSISSRISFQHGLPVDQLKLLTANPPETKITNLSELESYRKSDINTTTGILKLVTANEWYPASGNGGSSTKTVMIDNETGTHVEKHPDLWFEDGSVICRAENTLFCVHMSQLARHSLVFNDMFKLPQGLGSEESMQMGPFVTMPETRSAMGGNDPRMKTRTVPVVYLYDAAEDVANLFTALYDGPYVLEFSLSLLLTLSPSTFALQIVWK